MKNDRLLDALAAFSHKASTRLDTTAERSAKVAVMDTLAVALGALSHPAARAARRYAKHSRVSEGATIWGTGMRVTAETAALVNGVPLRAYDYNDLYIGKGGGHPSDMVPGLLALAQWRKASGRDLLGAIALGYEASVQLFDFLRLRNGGLDYPNIIAIACTCAAARLLGLSLEQTREALSMTVISHFASYEVESNDLNSRGDLTMWKRFNGSDAVRQSVYACLLAEAGAEGVVRPFEGVHGFLANLNVSAADLESLCKQLDPSRPFEGVSRITFKRWPVGSRGQSAIQAALQARAGIGDVSNIQSIHVLTDDDVYDHLVTQRSDPWNPISRETADHSLPCIVATAILDGEVGVETFDSERVLDPARRTLLNERLTVEASSDLSGGMSRGFLTRVEITDKSGKVAVGEAKAPPGHILNPFRDADFEEKLRDNVVPHFGEKRAEEIIQAVWSLQNQADLDGLCALLTLEQGGAIDDQVAGAAR